MRHHALTAVIGVVLAAALVPLSATSAAAADPSGYWRKTDKGPRPAKLQIYSCGSRGSICVKIAWLSDPFDSKGKPIHDIYNKNKSLTGRGVMGLPIARGLVRVGANQWKGNIYSPEDGNTYSATLTLVSRSKIILKGCKAVIFCGQRVWLRTSPPPKPEPEVKPEEQIEASAEPKAAPVAAAETAPEAAPKTATNVAAPAPAASEPAKSPLGEAEMITPAAQQTAQPGYRFLDSAAAAQGPANFTGTDVPSMFVMTNPLDKGAEGAGSGSVAAAESAALPTQPTPTTPPAPAAKPESVAKPKPVAKPESQPRTIQANAAPAPTPEPAAKAAPPAPAPKPAPASEAAAEPVEPGSAAETGDVSEPVATETAEADFAAPQRRLSGRERRRQRRQQRLQAEGRLPWLR